jgi:parallel beta-helix repeat protein
MKHYSFTFLLSLLMTMLCFTAAAQRPTTLYVNANYTGSTEDGSAAYPYKTIRKALDRRATLGLAGMTTDEEIVVKPGEYYPKGTDMLIINRYNCGINGKWLTIRSETPWAATIHGDSLYSTKFAAMVAITDSAQYVKVKQFTFEHLRNNPALTNWIAANGTDTASGPRVPSTYNGAPLVTPYGDTIYQSKKDVKFGIQIVSDSRHINIFDNDISDISWTSAVDPLKADSALTEAEKKILRNAWPNDNCGPVSVLGSDKDAMRDITIDGNEIYKCNPGWSENVTINGYIDTFNVINNLIHDVKNIGIVAAGNYPWVLDPGNGFNTPANQNYARNGIISGNIVYNCQSPYAASAGIYLDGARNVLIERNQIYQNHVGISVGNETPNSHSGGHIIRNNIVYDNVWTGMVLGSNGYNAWVQDVKVLNNTFYRNNSRVATLLTKKDGNGQVQIVSGVAVPDTFSDGGEIVTQRLSNSNEAPTAKIVVQNNIIRSRKGVTLSILTPFKTDSFTSASLTKTNLKNLLDWNYNLYYIEPGYNNAMNYDFASAGFTGNTYNFANYKTETGLDSNSKALELATTPSPDTVFTGGTTFPTRFTLRAGSAAYNSGNPSSSNSGSDDFIYHSRILNGRIDAGALEYYVAARPVASVQAITETIAAWSVFPNPAVNEVTVKLLQKEDGKTTVAIWDMQGRQVVKKQFMLAKGINAIKINNFKQAGFTSGTYLLKVSSPNESKIFKLIVE